MLTSLKHKFHLENIETLRQHIEEQGEWIGGWGTYLSTPLPSVTSPLQQLKYVAIDFETSGLDFKHDQILSIGLVPFNFQQIELSTVDELFISHGQYITAKSASVNQLTPKHLSQGLTIDAAMNKLFETLAGKVVLAHGAFIEKGFLSHYLSKKFGIVKLPFYFIDTMELERRFLSSNLAHSPASFQLDDLRENLGFPAYYNHSAASDALACAELFIARVHKTTSLANAALHKVMS